jgi:Zn-dependent M28 family amino/carboxypeptidase
MASLLTIILSGVAVLCVGMVLTAYIYIKNPIITPITYTSPTVQASKDRLYQHIDFLTDIQPARSFDNPQSLDTAANYIAFQLEKCKKATVTRQYFEVKGKKFQNIIAIFGDTATTAQRIVMGSHYDVCGDQAGADDNASAVAALLEIATLLEQNTQPLPYTIELVAYSLEEPPNFRTSNMGSYVHAKSLKDKGINVKLMICLEMLGYFSDAPSSQEYPVGLLKAVYPTVGNFIGVVGNFKDRSLVKQLKKGLLKYSKVPVESINAPESLRGIDFSDHQSYWKMGYPALMITDTAFFRNPHYHQTTDTIDTLDFARMAEVVTGLYASLWEIGE